MKGTITIFYALIFFVAGLYEAQMYFSARKNERPVSVWLLISAVLAVVFGVLVAVNHDGTLVSFLDKDQLPAVFMFCQAITDTAALVMAIRKQNALDESKKPSEALVPVKKDGE